MGYCGWWAIVKITIVVEASSAPYFLVLTGVNNRYMYERRCSIDGILSTSIENLCTLKYTSQKF